MGEVTELLERARSGEREAWDQVVALIYDDLKRIARGVLGGQGSATLNPTALVHDCYLRLSRAGAEGVVNREHFLSLAARAMRQLLLNHARDRVAAKRGGGMDQTALGGEDVEADNEAEHLVALDGALTRLGAVDERMVRVVECRVFAGMSEEETASSMGISLRSAQRLYADARAQLAVLLAG